jgi:hypothetical protein
MAEEYLHMAFKWLSTFRAPRFIDIQDVRLGVSNRVLQGLVLVYFILVMSISKEYEVKYTPKGFNQYFISAGTMYTDQTGTTFNDICTDAANGDYDYTDSYCASGDTFWCESSIGCYSPTSYEANLKLGMNAWIFTYQKDVHIIKGDCSTFTNQAYCNSQFSSSYTYKDYSGSETSSGLCGCEKYDNFFYRGVDGMKLTWVHSYSIDELDWSESNVITRVRKDGHRTTYGHLSGDYAVFPAGENVVLTVGEVLSIAGLSNLEEVHTYAMEVYPSDITTENLIYRLTGVEIDLDFQYIGSIGDTIPGGSNVECIMTISHRDGYSTRGNDVGYKFESYPVASTSEYDAEFHDKFLRGLYLSIMSGGSVGTFDFFNLIVVVTSISILLALSATLVSMVAYGLLGYTSNVYDSFGQQKLNMKRLHAKIAGQALIAGKVWRELVTDDIQASVGVNELTDAFLKQGYNEKDAKELAIALLSSKHADEDPGIEAIHEMMSTASNLVEVENLDASTSTKQRRASQIHREYQLSKVKEDSIDFYNFCDLLSEEQTSLYAAMGMDAGEIAEAEAGRSAAFASRLAAVEKYH